jgi:VWFA-related protein
MPITQWSEPWGKQASVRAPEKRSGAIASALLVALPILIWPGGLAGWQLSSSKPTPAAQGPAPATGAASPQAEKESIRIRVNVVNVPVTVLNKRGLPVIDLSQNDFEVFENGQRQSIRYFYRGDRPPLRIGLILDTSNTARPQLEFEKEGAGEFVFNMLQGRSSKNQIFLQTFDATSSFLQDLTNDPEALNEKIRKLKAGGGKALYDAIYFACKEKMLSLRPPNETRRVLVLISDGTTCTASTRLTRPSPWRTARRR